jgi:uncharacterized membrane protein
MLGKPQPRAAVVHNPATQNKRRCPLILGEGSVGAPLIKTRDSAFNFRLQRNVVRWFIALLALIGLLVSAAALREHYRTGTSPCSINDKWDCGIVNKSPESIIAGIPVADIGIAGYLLLGALAIRKMWRSLVAATVPALAFSLYLAYVEGHVLEVWCIYCVISLVTISLIALLSVAVLLKASLGKART